MIKKDLKNTMNFDVKSNLAKLLATENIVIQHNNVKTASFDVKNRVLTLPIFKQKSGDVYDMLIAHECAHALWTPMKKWETIDSKELRSYVNVLEDCRIDLKIQKKYPGVVRNYENGFDILEKQNFFGFGGKDINKDFMIIDKINLRSKSLNRLPFIFASKDNKWLAKVDALKTFNDVLALAKEMLEWQKDQVEQMKKLPDFDKHIISVTYDLNEDEEGDGDGDDESENGEGEASSDVEKSDEADEKNDFNNFGDQKADSEKDSNKDGKGSSKPDDAKEEDKKDTGKADSYAKGAGGLEKKDKPLKAITDDSFAQNSEKLLDEKNKGYLYGDIPTPNLKDDGCLVSYKKFLKDMRDWKVSESKHNSGIDTYSAWLDKSYKKFIKENKKTVMYLVKEFEMKKAATAYKRASTDKTGIIDPLKLPQYQYSEDIFKRLTIIPDGKNHGMMMLLDWSGSMSDVLMNTVKQLINLVEFTKKVNIPFEVYFFTSDRGYGDDEKIKGFSNKPGEWLFKNFKLVNCISHRMKKQEMDEAMKTLYHMGMYFNDRYSHRRNVDYDSEEYMVMSNSYGMPNQYYLGSTPLNESLIYMNKMIPMFQKKYGIEKLTFITLTDGSGNYPENEINGRPRVDGDWDKKNVYGINNKKFAGRHQITDHLLNHIRKSYDYVTVIGFYVIKRVKRWDIEKYVKVYDDYSHKDRIITKLRKQLTTDKAIAVDADGYDKFFLLDGKKLAVENFSMEAAPIKKGTPSEFKRIFGKSMANRLVSRVVLNKFIQEVA
jgi:hypothetical protein